MTDKKVWLITGAGRGLGLDIAKAALAAGHAVVATGRDSAKVTAAIGHHDDLLAIKLDVMAASKQSVMLSVGQRTSDQKYVVVAFRAKGLDAAPYTAMELAKTMARCNSKWRRVMGNGTVNERGWKPHILIVEYRSISWWYWLMSVGFLTAGVCGWPMGFLLAIGLTAFQLSHFTIRDQSVRTFPVQVRLAYLLLLLIAAPEKFRLIYWIPMLGTWVQVLFGYCAMARTVSLMPWNREQPLSVALLRQTFVSAPVQGSIMPGRQRVYTGKLPTGLN